MSQKKSLPLRFNSLPRSEYLQRSFTSPTLVYSIPKLILNILTLFNTSRKALHPHWGTQFPSYTWGNYILSSTCSQMPSILKVKKWGGGGEGWVPEIPIQAGAIISLPGAHKIFLFTNSLDRENEMAMENWNFSFRLFNLHTQSWSMDLLCVIFRLMTKEKH